MTNQSLLLVSILTLVAAGLLALSPSMIIGNAQAQMYNYDYENDHHKVYPDAKKSSDENIQKIKCINSNVNVNGIDITQIPQHSTVLATANAGGAEGTAEAANTQNDNGLADRINFDKNILNICVNVNLNKQVQENPLTLMTWNIYLGSNLTQIGAATTPNEFFTAVAAAYDEVQKTNFVERADSIADEIQESQPDLIGLQEVSLLRTQDPFDPTTPATIVSFDYLQILIDALAARGLIYEPIVVQTGSDLEVPGGIPGSLVDIRLTDRNVILARADKDFTLSNIQGAQFVAKVSLPNPFGPPISLPSSWVSVDVTFDKGDKARIVSTHLTPLSPPIQESQADELLNGPGNTNLPVIFIGDFNSKADGTGTSTYSKLLDAGFIDAWTIKGNGPGFTCCQAANLLNPNSLLNQRIDLILFRGNFDIKDIEIDGNLQNDRTISGLWPSDHAGVVAALKLNGDKN
jgi:endonuclease/exonuclease/phosphatase family metal-dependent hydrolase